MSTSISKLHILLNDTTIFSYEYDEKIINVDYSDIAELFAYATEEDMESVFIYPEDQMVLGFLTVASGQGGLAFALDAATKRIVHASDGAYTISIARYQGYLYSLCYIANYVTKGNIKLFRCPFGVINPSLEPDEVAYECNCDYGSYNGEIGSLSLVSSEKGLFLRDKNNTSPIIANLLPNRKTSN